MLTINKDDLNDADNTAPTLKAPAVTTATAETETGEDWHALAADKFCGDDGSDAEKENDDDTGRDSDKCHGACSINHGQTDEK